MLDCVPAKGTTMTLEDRAAMLWPNNLNYQAAWLRMINLLGDRWLLARRVTRGTV